jgi:fatty acid desaturase
VSDLEAAGLFDRERVRTARDLRVAGWVIMLFGVVVWIAVSLTVTQFGAWPLVVPWSILIVGLMFAVASFRVTLLSETGARVRMLYFARVRDGRTSA